MTKRDKILTVITERVEKRVRELGGKPLTGFYESHDDPNFLIMEARIPDDDTWGFAERLEPFLREIDDENDGFMVAVLPRPPVREELAETS